MPNTKRILWRTLPAILFLAFIAATGFAAAPKLPLPKAAAKASLSKETQLKLLQLQEAKVSLKQTQDSYELAKKDLEDMKKLFTEDVVTGKEVSEADTKYREAQRKLELAKISLAKTALSFLKETTHISIVSAQQFIDAMGNRRMALIIRNTSDLRLAQQAIGNGIPEAGIKAGDISNLMTIENLYVSIRAGSTVVGDPFEIHIPTLAYDKQITLNFRLSTDADEVTVSMNYQNQEDARSVYLTKQSGEDIVRVSSVQFAQEGQLGAWVNYDLELERLAEDEKTFALRVANLPPEYDYQFTDQGNQLSQVKFSQGTSKRQLVLKVFVPDTLSAQKLNKPLNFYAVVGYEGTMAALDDRKSGMSAPGLQAMKVGFERLELTPRGTGKMDMSFTNLYYEKKVGEKIVAKMTLNNTGSVDLSNIRIKVEKPLDWIVKLDPETVTSLGPDKQEDVVVTISAPENTDVGAYEVKFQAECDVRGTTVQTDQKTLRAQLSAKTNLTGNIILVAALIAAVVGIAIFTVKLSRR